MSYPWHLSGFHPLCLTTRNHHDTVFMDIRSLQSVQFWKNISSDIESSRILLQNKQTNKQKQDKTKQNKTLSVLIAKFVASLSAFCKIRRNLSFFCSVHHLSGPLREHMFTCTSSKGHGLWFVTGGFRSVLIVSCFKVRCFVIVLFLALID